MATVTFSIKDTKITEAEDAVAALYGYEAFITDTDGKAIPNPLSKSQFLARTCKGWVRNQVIEYRNRTALATAAAQDSEL